ncbi:MAG TPA: DUF362 domain-containing protein [Candidatus Caccousia avistercoris]|nr:DUF362 domain-containing protein [Candidatus Caccousia avistercoris]
MEKAKVYFTDFHTDGGVSLLQKLRRLVKKAGIDTLDYKDRFTAIKLHFGEPGNLAYLRPNYAKVIADIVRENGGKPFLTDCNTLYVGGRKNALDHMDSAYLNGYNPFATGCHVIIADGLKGTDEVAVPVKGGEFVKEAKIGRALMDADNIISLTHFKGHEATGFGGVFKNIGMGGGSRAGKMEMHNAGKPYVNQEKCVGCGMCQRNCAHSAISIADRKASIDPSKCVGCGRCIGACHKDAVQTMNDEANDILNKKMVEYAAAILQNKPCFHISLICDVSPFCDCHAENDVPIIPDVGMLASFDPVALDQACADLCNAQPAVAGSRIAGSTEKDHFHANHPVTDWRSQISHGEKMGLGTSQYELITV